MYGEGVKGDRSINGGLRVLTMLHPRYEGLQKMQFPSNYRKEYLRDGERIDHAT